MQVAIRSFLLVFLLVFLIACSPTIDFAARPTVQILRVSYPTSLQPLVGRFQDCAGNFPAAAIFLEETPAASLDTRGFDIALWAGEPPDPGLRAFTLGQEQIQVVVNPKNPAEDLSASEIRNLLNGRYQSWEDVGEEGEVSVWVFPPENELQRLFTEAFMRGEGYSPFARIAPDPAAMIEAVSADPGAIGILLGSWVGSSLKTLSLEDPVSLPVLALTAQEPEGVARELLACVQSSQSRETIPALVTASP